MKEQRAPSKQGARKTPEAVRKTRMAECSQTMQDDEDSDDEDDEEEEQQAQKPQSDDEDDDERGELPFLKRGKETRRPVPASESRKEKQTVGKKPAPAYKLKAPVEVEDDEVEEIVERLMNANIHLTSKELIAMAPILRNKVKRLLTKRRWFDQGTRTALVLEAWHNLLEAQEEAADGIEWIEELPQAKVAQLTQSKNGLDGWVVSDPYLTYLESVPAGLKPKSIMVASESHALKVVNPLINGTTHKECILDPGSQIVSMSEAAAKEAKIHWDPNVIIHVESANKGLDKSLGLAKNVPFNFGEVTVYLQVHVIKGPAYDVLLGRPFEVITRLNVSNEKDGSQTITLTDPNNATKRISIPTEDRFKKQVVNKQPVEETFFRRGLRN